jgi:apolipoprotein N-acyltransferase
MNKLLDILCLLIGALLPLAFAPTDWYILAWILPGMLIPLWMNATPKRAALRGALFGCGFFGVGVSWVYVSIHVHGYAPIWLAALLTLLFVAVLALFTAGCAWTFRRLFSAPKLTSWCIGFPVLWVLWEWIRGWILSGFPWLYLGYSQVEGLLSGFVPVVGIYGTTFIITAVSGSLAYAVYQHNKKSPLYLLPAILLLALGYGLTTIQWTQANNDIRQVSLIQGNIPQEEKWDRQYVQSIIKKYTDLTALHWDSSLIIWPEAALPIPLPASLALVDSLDQAATQHNTTLIMGLLAETPDTNNYYNGIIALGTGQGLYHKRQLVPFGEFVPFENILRGLIQFFNLPFSSIVPGDSVQPVLESGAWKIAPLICYEIAYATLAEGAARQGNIILTISNDSWFGRSLGPKQHLQIAQFRALETGRTVIRATNNGITAIINPQGQITQQIPAFTTTVLTGDADTTQGLTPIVRLGHNMVLGILFIMLIVCVWINRRFK